jgi:transglutaminase-like putative cysteine protease
MRLHIDHITTFSYDEPISEAHTTVRMKPLDGGGQRCLSFSLSTEPRGEVHHYTDFHGNDVRHFDILQPHQKLVITAASDVITPETPVEEPGPLAPLEQFDYLSETNYAPFAESIHRLATSCCLPDDPYRTALELMQTVHRALTYERGVTDVRTTAPQALELGRGVCQDFTHIMLAACRSLGLPARYVSGYLYGPNSTGRDAATHAWVDVHVDGRGWLALDPTHDLEQTANYVRLAIGRDYADVKPTHGVYTGNAAETLAVTVRVFRPEPDTR